MPTAPGYADVSVKLQHATMARPAYITFGVDPTATDPEAVANAVNVAFGFAGSLKSIIDNNVTMSGIRVSYGQDGTEDTVWNGIYSVACSRTLGSLPPNVAVLCHKNTTRGGRRGRGRLFLPWATGSVDENGLIQSAEMTTLSTAVAVFLTQLGVNAVPMVVLHGPGISAPGAPNVVTTLTPDRLISTQRRRLGR